MKQETRYRIQYIRLSLVSQILFLRRKPTSKEGRKWKVVLPSLVKQMQLSHLTFTLPVALFVFFLQYMAVLSSSVYLSFPTLYVLQFLQYVLFNCNILHLKYFPAVFSSILFCSVFLCVSHNVFSSVLFPQVFPLYFPTVFSSTFFFVFFLKLFLCNFLHGFHYTYLSKVLFCPNA